MWCQKALWAVVSIIGIFSGWAGLGGAWGLAPGGRRFGHCLGQCSISVSKFLLSTPPPHPTPVTSTPSPRARGGMEVAGELLAAHNVSAGG